MFYYVAFLQCNKHQIKFYDSIISICASKKVIRIINSTFSFTIIYNSYNSFEYWIIIHSKKHSSDESSFEYHLNNHSNNSIVFGTIAHHYWEPFFSQSNVCFAEIVCCFQLSGNGASHVVNERWNGNCLFYELKE